MKLCKLLGILGLASLITFFQGCDRLASGRPGKEQIKTYLAGRFPDYVEIQDIQTEYVRGSAKGQWTINVKVIVAPKEDLLTGADVNELGSIRTRIEGVVAWHNDYLRTKKLDDPDVEIKSADAPKIWMIQFKKGNQIAINGQMSVQKQETCWGATDTLKIPVLGQPASAIGVESSARYIKGTQAAADAFKKYREVAETDEAKKAGLLADIERIKKERQEAVDRRIREERKKEEDKRRAAEEAKAAARAAVMAGSQLGVSYIGTFVRGTSTEKVRVEFQTNEQDGRFMEFKIVAFEKPDQWVSYTGHITSQDNEPNVMKMYYFVGQRKEMHGMPVDKTSDLAKLTGPRVICPYPKEYKTLRIEGAHLEMIGDTGRVQADRPADNEATVPSGGIPAATQGELTWEQKRAAKIAEWKARNEEIAAQLKNGGSRDELKKQAQALSQEIEQWKKENPQP
ncbi:MAG: hypothetical protein PHQ12_01985 [Chthoniobacteraceae bacterium]|nr:hypothetical protein [Chthoniobacteraceae bacterium]